MKVREEGREQVKSDMPQLLQLLPLKRTGLWQHAQRISRGRVAWLRSFYSASPRFLAAHRCSTSLAIGKREVVGLRGSELLKHLRTYGHLVTVVAKPTGRSIGNLHSILLNSQQY